MNKKILIISKYNFIIITINVLTVSLSSTSTFFLRKRNTRLFYNIFFKLTQCVLAHTITKLTLLFSKYIQLFLHLIYLVSQVCKLLITSNNHIIYFLCWTLTMSINKYPYYLNCISPCKFLVVITNNVFNKINVNKISEVTIFCLFNLKSHYSTLNINLN